MSKIKFYGRTIKSDTTRGLYHGIPYIVMSTNPYKITVMMKKSQGWIVTSFYHDEELFKIVCNQRIHSKINAEKLMKHERKEKVRSQGRSGSSDSMKYKQVTVYAYWANLDSIKSGNASMIASNFYNE